MFPLGGTGEIIRTTRGETGAVAGWGGAGCTGAGKLLAAPGLFTGFGETATCPPVGAFVSNTTLAVSFPFWIVTQAFIGSALSSTDTIFKPCGLVFVRR